MVLRICLKSIVASPLIAQISLDICTMESKFTAHAHQTLNVLTLFNVRISHMYFGKASTQEEKDEKWEIAKCVSKLIKAIISKVPMLYEYGNTKFQLYECPRELKQMVISFDYCINVKTLSVELWSNITVHNKSLKVCQNIIQYI